MVSDLKVTKSLAIPSWSQVKGYRSWVPRGMQARRSTKTQTGKGNSWSSFFKKLEDVEHISKELRAPVSEAGEAGGLA